MTDSIKRELLETTRTQTQINVRMKYVRPINYFAAGNIHIYIYIIQTTQQTNPYTHAFDVRQTTLELSTRYYDLLLS